MVTSLSAGDLGRDRTQPGRGPGAGSGGGAGGGGGGSGTRVYVFRGVVRGLLHRSDNRPLELSASREPPLPPSLPPSLRLPSSPTKGLAYTVSSR